MPASPPDVAVPTVILGVDRFGGQVLDRLRLAMDLDSTRIAALALRPDEVGSRMPGVLEELLRAGRGPAGGSREPRLDILVFASVLQGADGDLARVATELSHLVAHRYGAMFPSNRAPEQRTATLHLVLAVPALAPGDPARRSLERLELLEAASPGTGYPLLSRVWLVAQQTTAGTLRMEDLVATCATFAVATVGSGLRDGEPVRRRMAAHERGEGLFGFLSVASLDLPLARIRAYATARAAYDGLSTLVARVEIQVTDPAVGLAAVSTLEHEGWLGRVAQGDPAQRLRRVANRRSGAPSLLLDEPVVGVFDDAMALRSHHPAMFRPFGRAPEESGGEIAEMDEALRSLDGVEARVVQDIDHALNRLVDQALASDSGLRRLPEVEAGLRRVLATLDQAADKGGIFEAGAEPAPVRPSSGSSPEGVDSSLVELESRLGALPGSRLTALVAGAVGLAVGFLATMLTLFVLAPAAVPASAAVPSSALSSPTLAAPAVAVAATTPSSELLPWLAGLVAALAVGGAFWWLVGRWAAGEARAALRARRDAVHEMGKAATRNQPSLQAEAWLLLRQERVRRGARLGVERVRRHLEAVRRALLMARDQARQELRDMGVVPAEDARLDDLAGLVGPGEILHRPLVPAPTVAEWCARCRVKVEPDTWADALLAATWPRRGLLQDVPVADRDAVGALSQEQVRPLSERNLFEDPIVAEAAAGTVRDFGLRVGAALAAPCQPRNRHGDPAPGLRAGEVLVVAPLAGRDALEDAIRGSNPGFSPLWTPAPTPRVAFIRTWEGFTLQELTMGIGFSGQAPPVGGDA